MDAPSAVVLPSELPWKQSQGKQNLPLSSHGGGLGRGRAAFTPAAFSLGPRGLRLQKQQGHGKETLSQSSLDMMQPSPGRRGLIIPYFCDRVGVCSDFGARVRALLPLAAVLVGTSCRTELRSENSLNHRVSTACASSEKKISPC